LLYITRHNAKVYDFLKDTLSGLNWKLRFDLNQKTFRLSEVREDEILDYNLDLLSDSLKRLFFYSAVILTSEDVTLVMDEPDVFAFPPYPKLLGEMIGADTSNQFFLTTHNPYFLAGIAGKTPADKLALFVCFRDPEGSTAVKLLGAEDISRIIELGANVFFNLDEFLQS
jgi:AAA15 family ATPase/GTPase